MNCFSGKRDFPLLKGTRPPAPRCRHASTWQPTYKGTFSFGFMAQPHPQTWSCAQFKSRGVFIRKSFHHTVQLPVTSATSDGNDVQRAQDMPSWWGNSQGRKAVMSGNSSPDEIPNSTPCNERPPGVHRRYPSTWSRRDCRGKGTAPAGSGAHEQNGHPCAQKDGTTVTAAPLRVRPPRGHPHAGLKVWGKPRAAASSWASC